MSETERHVVLLAGRLTTREARERIEGLALRLKGVGIVPEVVCLAAGDFAPDGIEVKEVPALGHSWQRPWAVRKLAQGDRWRSSSRPDLFHVLAPRMSRVGLELAERLEVPYVLTLDEFIPPGGRLCLSRKWCRRLVATSPELAADLVRSLGVPGDLIAEVPPGVPILERPDSVPGWVRVPVIGTAARLAAGSGLATFLNAARHVLDAGTDAEFVIAGHGEAEAELRRRAERLRIADRTTFADDPDDGSTFWDVLDVFCLTAPVPTVGRRAIQALGRGIAVVASNVAGLRAAVRHRETGLLVPPRDAEALAAAILTLLANPDEARTLGDRGRAWVAQTFDPDAEARRLAELYDEALHHSFEPRFAELAHLGECEL